MTIKIRRKRISFLLGGFRKYSVIVDAKEIGNLANGQEQSFMASAGQHTVQIKGGWRSELVEVHLSPNTSIELECGVTPQFQKIYWVLFTLLLLYILPLIFIGRVIRFLDLGILAGGICVLAVSSKPGAACYLKIVDGQRGQ